MRWISVLLLTAGLMGCYVEGSAYAARPAVQYQAGYSAGYQQSTYVQPAQPQGSTVYVQPAAQPAAPPPQQQCVCRQGAQEICNGCDDNCNGTIDENCVR